MPDQARLQHDAVDALLVELAQVAAQLTGTARALAAHLAQAKAPSTEIQAVIKDLTESATAIEARIRCLSGTNLAADRYGAESEQQPAARAATGRDAHLTRPAD